MSTRNRPSRPKAPPVKGFWDSVSVLFVFWPVWVVLGIMFLHFIVLGR